jgi:hypothetical protein
VFTIVDPALKLDELEQVQRDVAALLEHGLNPPTPETPLVPGQPAPSSGAEAPASAAEPAAPGGPASAGPS